MMKKISHLLSIVLLSTIALTSCGEDKIVNENIGGGNEAEENLTDYTFVASIKQNSALSTRSNLQNGVYAWNKGDAVTLWNRNVGVGYSFAITSAYNDVQPSKDAEFTGKATVENGHKLVAVFPQKEAKTFNELATFTMPEVFVQTGNAAELTATTYMVATGDVTDSKIPSLTFSPLTALIQFNLKNTSDRGLKIHHITLESSDNIFPSELKIDDNGVVQNLSGMRSKFVLDMSEQTLNANATLNGYLNILPTTYGDIRLMKNNTELSVTVNVWNGEMNQDITVLKKVQVKDLEAKVGLNMEATAYQFAAGRHYEMDFEVDYRFQIPEEGYLVDDESNIHIYNKKGLLGWKQIIDSYRQSTVTLEKSYIQDGVIDLAGETWESIASFEGVFEGNGITISNLKMVQGGFVAANNGTIRNLTLKDVIFSNSITSETGALAATNSGVVLNCAIDGVTMTVTRASNVGGLIGTNTYPGKIENSRVQSGTINLNLSGSGSGNFGGLVGMNYGGAAIILNSFVGAITINHPSNSANASNVGGLLGLNDNAQVKGCYSLATITVNCSAQLGALVGAVGNGIIQASYAAGSISGNAGNNTGGLIGTNFGAKGEIVACYSTTQLSVTGGKVAALMGNNNGIAKQCYFVQALDAVKAGSSIGMAKATLGQFADKVRPMNLAIEAVEPGFGFNFKVNTEETTKTSQPLILQPAVKVPGFGGSDFGNGGDI